MNAILLQYSIHDENLENYYKNIRENKDFTFLDRMGRMKSIMGIITGPVRSDICVLKKMEDVVIAAIMDVLMRIAIH